MEVIRGIRDMRGEMKIHPGTTVKCVAAAGLNLTVNCCRSYSAYVELLANCELEIADSWASKAETGANYSSARNGDLFTLGRALVDLTRNWLAWKKRRKPSSGYWSEYRRSWLMSSSWPRHPLPWWRRKGKRKQS